MRPQRTETDSTWKILRPLKDSCLLSFKLLVSNTLNCSHQSVLQLPLRPALGSIDYFVSISPQSNKQCIRSEVATFPLHAMRSILEERMEMLRIKQDRNPTQWWRSFFFAGARKHLFISHLGSLDILPPKKVATMFIIYTASSKRKKNCLIFKRH